MAKNFGKILLGLTAAGAAGAGAYYWLKNRHNEEPEDEFDDSFEEDDFELDDDLGEVPERGYTTLTPTSAKEEASEEPVEKNKDAETESEKAASQQNPEENLFFLPGLLLPFRYFGSLNELFSETILLNTRCSLDES